MDADDLIGRARQFAAPYRVTRGKGFRLKDVDPGDTAGLDSEEKDRAQGGPAERRRGTVRRCRNCSTPRTAGPCC